MRRRKNIFTDGRMYVMALLAVISIGVIVAMAVVSKNKKDNNNNNGNNIIDLNDATRDDMADRGEDTEREEPTTDGTDEEPSFPEGDGGFEEPTEDESELLDNEPEEDETTGSEDDAEVGIIPVGELFSNTMELEWPVIGNIILDYSMDKTVYFPITDVYKCNAGIMIQSEVGTSVVASAAGTVTEVSENEEIGRYAVIDLGDGYKAIYGQIENICVAVGNVVTKGEKIGTVAEPTKYYSIEGCNVYFQLDYNGTPIDPVEYFVY